MSKQYKLLSCTINGKKVEKMIDVRASLTDVLRDDFRLTSVKKGCEVGECGACNVLIDGEAYNSCIYLAVWAEGKHIRTLEGLLGPNGELSDIQQAFVDEAAIQCGVCTPGFILTAVEILEGESWRLVATSEEVCEVLAGVEFTELYPDEVPLLADKDGEFWAVAAPSSPGVLWEDIEDVLSE